ncbi:MAG: glutathione synthase, partial [Myxococcota bacterium]
GDGVWLRGQEITVQKDPAKPFTVGAPVHAAAVDFAAIFIRTDPPFDEAYLNTTWLLSFAVAAGANVVNDPKGIRNGNEKLYALEFADLCPETIVTASLEDVRAFLARVDGQAVAKPLDGHGGFGVMRLRDGDSNVNAIVETLSLEGRQPIIVQRYLPEATEGDRRLFMLDGELAAVLQRTPAADDHRGNVHVGGTTSATEVSDQDRLIAERLGPRLKADGILFAGLDVIAGKLIEINVTSPTLVQELRNHGGPDLAVSIIDRVLGE